MPNQNKKNSSPFCLRLSEEERAQLEFDAAGLSLSEHARQRLFDETIPKRLTRGKYPVKDHQQLSQLLGEFGRSRIPNNLNQIAKAVNMGLLNLSSEEKLVLIEACTDIREIKITLFNALGLKNN